MILYRKWLTIVKSILLASAICFFMQACSARKPEENRQQTGSPDSAAGVGMTETVTASEDAAGYAYTFSVENGAEITIRLPREPEQWAELHLCDLDGTGNLNRVILHNTASGTGVWLEEARVFDGESGEELAVTPVDDVIASYVSVTDADAYWSLLISGAEYKIDKAQFADYAPEEKYDMPKFDCHRNFSVERGQLYCDVGILCAGMGTGYAKESLRIRYGFDAGRIVPAEITFLRTEAAAES